VVAAEEAIVVINKDDEWGVTSGEMMMFWIFSLDSYFNPQFNPLILVRVIG
jgi:hypothetical protein